MNLIPDFHPDQISSLIFKHFKSFGLHVQDLLPLPHPSIPPYADLLDLPHIDEVNIAVFFLGPLKMTSSV